MIRSLVEPTKNGLEEDTIIRRNLTIEELEDVIDASMMVWLDIVDPSTSEIEWLQHRFSLHPLIVEDLERLDRRPSISVHNDYTFLSLFQPILTGHRVEGQEIHCVLGESYYLTVRQERSVVVEQAYNRAAQNSNYWKRGLTYFLYLTMQAVIDAYYPLLDSISNRLNKIEEQLLVSSGRLSGTQDRVYRIKQQLINLRQMVAPQREVLSNAIGEEQLSRTNESRDLFRHLYERLVRVYDIIDSQRDLSSNVLDLISSKDAALLGEAVNRLTIFSMIFLPLTFVTGLFELNFITTESAFQIPLQGGIMFALIVSLMILIVVLMVWFFRRRGWL